MVSKIINRIQRQVGDPNLFDVLANSLSASDLQSLLLEVYAHRTERLTPAAVLKNYQNDKYVKPASSDLMSLMAFDGVAFELADKMGYTPLELSPVAPIGTCSVVATAHQHKIMSTIRNSEVLSDCTNVLALESASRRKEKLKSNPKSSGQIRLCASHRLVRTQPLPDPRFLPHFKIFGLCTAGRDTGSFNFEINSLKEHLTFYLEFMTSENMPYLFKNIQVLVTKLQQGAMADLIKKEIFIPLKENYSSVSFEFYPERKMGRGYYSGLCFQINAVNKSDDHFMLADGGFTDWTQQYLSNKKERVLISGIGSELVCLYFKKY